MSQSNELSRRYYVTPGLCNARKELPLPHLVSDIIELATEHANILGFGFKQMTPKGIGWVLSRLSVKMLRYPKFGEHFTLSTWIEDWNRHFSIRDFMLQTDEGEILGYARSIWMVIDLVNHTNAGTSSLNFSTELISKKEIPIPPLKKVHNPVVNTSNEYTFRYTDIDFYGHVNTVRYIELLLNQFPLSRYETSFVSRFEIAFKHEGKYGETAQLDISELAEGTYHILLKRDEQQLVESQLVFEENTQEEL